jgi:hypothetical protein
LKIERTLMADLALTVAKVARQMNAALPSP